VSAQRAVVIVALALMASLSVACQDQGPELALGAAQVTVGTSGVDLDPDGYSVRVDGGSVQPVSINGTITLSALSAGDHAVALNGVAANCEVSGDSLRTVRVSVGVTERVEFVITCAQLTGDLYVTMTTTGTNVDPDGYSVSVDGGAAQPISVNDSVTVSALSAGSHTVLLAGAAANCAIDGSNPRSIVIQAGRTTQVVFSVTCVATSGSLALRIVGGTDLGPAYYLVSLDGVPSRWGLADAVLLFTEVSAGVHSVIVSGVASNCALNPPSPYAITVSPGDTTELRIGVTCVATGEQIAFVSKGESSSDIYVVESNGTILTRLASGQRPVWSPDGGRIVFSGTACGGAIEAGGSEICVMNADGTGVANLSDDPADDADPTWSPDGLRIAFRSMRDGRPELYVMEADGSGAWRLTNGVGVAWLARPAWSPNGTRIAFDCRVDASNLDICVVNVDGTGFGRLTVDRSDDFGPSWKPDGSQLAFASSRYGQLEIAVMNPDGTGVSPLFPGVEGWDPAWSPDGTRIAISLYLTAPCDVCGANTNVIAVMSVDGSSQTIVSWGASFDLQPAWRPATAAGAALRNQPTRKAP